MSIVRVVRVGLIREGRIVLRSGVLHHQSTGHTVEGLAELIKDGEHLGLLYRPLPGCPALVGDDGQLDPLRLLLEEPPGVGQDVAVHIEGVDLLHLPDVPRLADHLLPQLLELLLLPLLHLDNLQVEDPAGTLNDVEDVEVLILWSSQHDSEGLPARHGLEERRESLDDGGGVGDGSDGGLQDEPVEEENLGGGPVLVGEDCGVVHSVQRAGEVVGEGGRPTEGSLQGGVLCGLPSGESRGRVLGSNSSAGQYKHPDLPV